MDGIYINGKRPASKKAVKEALNTTPESVEVETTRFGHEALAYALDLKPGTKVNFVGPDPYTSRKFYGTLQRTTLGFKVT
ncbi:MAG: hypothetical protein K0Q89_47 [Thermomicrobiales bacterium]|jgi:hypothetical protein|nr:hypothetical protein [Thermomicrobiales bacterium]